jgi:hypothetical protein
MTIQEKKEELKKHYGEGMKRNFFTDDCEHITQIDFDNEIVYYYVYVTAPCGCCSETDDRESDLDYFLQYLSDDDYQLLLNELKSV